MSREGGIGGSGDDDTLRFCKGPGVYAAEMLRKVVPAKRLAQNPQG